MEDFEKPIQAHNLRRQVNPINQFGDSEDVDPEFAKALPVGHINAYGKQKQSDGSWKYVGKNKGTSSSATSKENQASDAKKKGDGSFKSWLKENSKKVENKNPRYVPHLNAMLKNSGFKATGDSKNGFAIEKVSTGEKVVEASRLSDLTSKIKSTVASVSGDSNTTTTKQTKPTTPKEEQTPSSKKEITREDITTLNNYVEGQGRNGNMSVDYGVEKVGDKLLMATAVNGKPGYPREADLKAMSNKPSLPPGYKYKTGSPIYRDGKPMTRASVKEDDESYDDRGYQDSEFYGEAYYEVVPK